MLGDGLEADPVPLPEWLTDFHEEAPVLNDPLADIPTLPLVCIRDRSGEKWIELIAGERRVGVGVVEVAMPDSGGEALKDCTPVGRLGRLFMPLPSSI